MDAKEFIKSFPAPNQLAILNALWDLGGDNVAVPTSDILKRMESQGMTKSVAMKALKSLRSKNLVSSEKFTRQGTSRTRTLWFPRESRGSMFGRHIMAIAKLYVRDGKSSEAIDLFRDVALDL